MTQQVAKKANGTKLTHMDSRIDKFASSTQLCGGIDTLEGRDGIGRSLIVNVWEIELDRQKDDCMVS
ncbi:hypothetical protein BTVI_72004 [Pitangus sulphuratus]|nr:hypothetical protein BTVI_72004 [Pitangus sulphuratus]